MHTQLFLIGTVILCSLHLANALQCYQCTDCPEPFSENYPYVSVVNNSNYNAQCLKSIVNLGDGRRLVSKGSVFACPTPVNSGDIQALCCNRDYCNSATRFGPSVLFLLFIFARLYL